MLPSYLSRKKKFVSSRIQGRLMLRFALYWTLYHIVLWHAVFVFRYIQYRLEAQGTGILIPFRELYGTFVLDYYPLAVCAFAALPIVLLDMLYLTHRVAGPLVRFQRALRDLSEGKPVRPVKLRPGDLLIEFQEEFNRYLESLGKQEQGAAAAHQKSAADPASPALAASPFASRADSPTASASGADAVSDEERQVVEDLAELRKSLQSHSGRSATPSAGATASDPATEPDRPGAASEPVQPETVATDAQR